MYEDVGLSILWSVGSGVNLVFTPLSQKQKKEQHQQESDNAENTFAHLLIYSNPPIT